VATPFLNGCDCHVHIVGNQTDFPMIAGRQYTADTASVVELQAHLKAVGMQRVVLIQPSFYGTDNRCMLEALQSLNGMGRGVAVVDENASLEELLAMKKLGICGLRLNLESSSDSHPGTITQTLRRWAEKIAPLDWHLQLFASLESISQAANEIRALPVPVVLDHFALASPKEPNSAQLKSIFDLVESGTYVKLSAPYRLSVNSGANKRELIQALAQRFISVNPQRILWGSDWPHTNREKGKAPLQISAYRNIPSASLNQDLSDWFANEKTKVQILRFNPAELYGFESTR
jgi:predicted TIM-barrel fold metal-dependent hydrolase